MVGVSGQEIPALQVSAVSKVFGERKALDSVSFEVPQGAFLSIFGPNGAGKTTLLRVLSTLTRPSYASISVLGIDAKEQPDEVRSHIGLISHNSMLYPDLTAEENLMFVARMYGIQNPEERVREMLTAVELDHRRFDTVRTFSRGMTQRLSIARALLNNPTLVFLDEPYAGLDPHAVEIFDGLLESLRKDRIFVMVSHDLEKGFSMCSHLLVLARGRTVAYEKQADVDFEKFKQLYMDIVGMGVA